MIEKGSVKERLQSASRKWNLTGIESIYEKNNKGVYRAESAEFASVILKLGSDNAGLSGEFQALTEMKGDFCCQVYAFDPAYCFLLEEQVLPGTTLKQEPDWKKRAICFSEVFENIHVVPKSQTSYRSYLDWVRDACRSVTDQQNKELSTGMNFAVEIAERMFGRYPERQLLHGDLHHENLLQNEDGNYVIIDPKGVVGPPIFDIPRFVLNELDDSENSLRRAHISKVIEVLSHVLSYPCDDLYQLLFMEIMLENAWNFEDGEEIEGRDVKLAWEMIEEDTQTDIDFFRKI